MRYVARRGLYPRVLLASYAIFAEGFVILCFHWLLIGVKNLALDSNACNEFHAYSCAHIC